MPDGLDKILDEVRKDPELLLTKYLRAERLVLREDDGKKGKSSGQRVYKDAVVLFTEGMAFFIDDQNKLHQVAPDVVQEIIYSPAASQWMRQLMLFSASQMINQLMISKKFERPEP
jgi:hypothetical protein